MSKYAVKDKKLTKAENYLKFAIVNANDSDLAIIAKLSLARLLTDDKQQIKALTVLATIKDPAYQGAVLLTASEDGKVSAINRLTC